MNLSTVRSLPVLQKLRLLAVILITGACLCAAQSKPTASAPDELVLSNGDTLHGKLIKEVDGTVTFHTDPLGDVKVKWSDVKALHTTEPFAVLNSTEKLRNPKRVPIPAGPLDVQNQSIAVHAENAAPPAPIPVKNAAYIVDQATLAQQVFHQPSFFSGWNGAATAGITLVQATQSQYTESGSIGLMRTVPGVPWLNPRNRTSADFSGSFGKITQPGGPTVKTAIFHADAERDRYFSSRFFALAQVAFDHNFSQLLALQSVYGAGIGFTILNNPREQLDTKATLQYEKQQFINPPPPTLGNPSQNLIGSTFSLNYMLRLKLLTFMQEAAFVPAYNIPSAYSANETNSVSFPAYKNFQFSVGTLDSYLNDPPRSTPPTRSNSFQFTMGLAYDFKSAY